MIKLSVMYPKGDGTTFDLDYYRTTHMDIVQRTMSPTKIEIDDVNDGPFVAIGHLYFESPDAFGAAIGAGDEASADVANFTNAVPTMQISNVIER